MPVQAPIRESESGLPLRPPPSLQVETPQSKMSRGDDSESSTARSGLPGSGLPREFLVRRSFSDRDSVREQHHRSPGHTRDRDRSRVWSRVPGCGEFELAADGIQLCVSAD